MARAKAEIVNKYGLHMRPAGMIVDVASRFDSDIKIKSKDREASAKSIMELSMLAVSKGSIITIEAEGEDAFKAVIGIKELIDGGFKKDN